ncbi:alpha/beta hydrolase [Larkinella rosea]|uniref:Alpha/beta hydrolase n=1 Tax=Larkinella rosea TaxID=2025312 RepID=A0A3P1BCZ6_9BACT|nr:alpha/beta hydrolase-fold protein [Larkinella rosea]RRA98765.1 alpha/beta hydrolase [Larkinella rosea]
MKAILPIFILNIITTLVFGQTRKPFVLGVIEEIKSVELAENRILNIYLPPDYNPADTTKYPVVYLLDGSADEDFIHIVGLYQFNNFPWINRVPKSIIVGIANVDRRRDFTFPTTIEKDIRKFTTAGQSARFIRFLEKELQPYIQTKYKTSTARTLIGQSLGGLLATEILLKKPTLFNRYIIISPSLWWDNGSLLNQQSDLLQKAFTQKTGVYIGVGKEGLTPGDIPHVMEVDANLLVEKLNRTESKTVSIHFDYLPQEDHATITHQAVFNALRLLYPPAQNR